MRLDLFAAPKDRPDYTQPETRRELFWDAAGLHFWQLAACGLLILVCRLPFLATALIRDMQAYTIGQQVEAGAVDAGAAAGYLASSSNLLAALEILFWLLLAVALAAVARPVRQMAWGEHVALGPDLLKGAAQNARLYLLLGLAAGLVSFACACAGQGGVWLPSLVLAVVLGPLAGYMLVTSCIYDLPAVQHLRYALLLYGSAPVPTLLASAACVLVFVPQLLPSPFWHILGRAASSLALPFVLLGWSCFVNARLDERINPDYYPALTRRGLAGGERKDKR